MCMPIFLLTFYNILVIVINFRFSKSSLNVGFGTINSHELV